MSDTTHLRLPVSEEALAAINDLIHAGKDDISPGRFCFQKISAAVKQYAEPANRVRFSGHLDVGDKVVRPSDLRSFPLESGSEGSVSVVIGPIVKAGIERACAVTDAINRVAGSAPLGWKTSAEWCLRVVEESVARETAKEEGTDADAEERELYDPPKKAP
ncbi:MAG: hypothetical protein ACREB9_04925 [Thermoplasmata archaeon]